MSPEMIAVPSPPEAGVADEIARALLATRESTEVYQLALERLVPLIGASFGCVFLREDDTDLLRVASAYNWPERYATHLDILRVRVGNGPAGRAVLDGHPVDVDDVFADPELEDWRDAARELEFSSSIALPICFAAMPVGALTFYFRDHDAFVKADRALLRLVTHQLSATAEKAHLLERLKRVETRLLAQEADLQRYDSRLKCVEQRKDEALGRVIDQLRGPLAEILDDLPLLREKLRDAPAKARSTGHPATRREQRRSRFRQAGEAGVTDRIGEAASQMDSLIRGLQELTDLRLGRVERNPGLTDAIQLARAAVEKTAPERAGEPEGVNSPRLELLAERVPVHTCPTTVHQVLDILLSEASGWVEGSEITLRVTVSSPEEAEVGSQGALVTWELRNPAMEFEPALLEKLFEELHREEDSELPVSGEKSGLGLAIARSAARALGGDVTATSDPGKGSAFHFTIPSRVVRASAS
ncbi:MAG: GAF domain-containing sensor histidine kinase [Gemmatimonadota bacterium]|jgi:signal transduction histidine kinase|nr:GAF domain-containing sensor histidine kinase [Gemmatimonadota bacterium]